MFEKIKEQLKQQGLPEGLASFVQARVSNENEIEGVVNELNQAMPASQLPNSFDEILQQKPEFQSEFDRRLKQAQDTREQNVRAELQNTGQGQTGQNNNGGQSNGEGQGQNGNGQNDLNKTIQALKQEIENLKSERNQESKQEKAKQLLKDNGLSENELKFVDLDAENLEEEVKGVKQYVDQIKQNAIKEQVSETGTPPPSQQNADETAVEKIAKEKNSEEAETMDLNSEE